MNGIDSTSLDGALLELRLVGDIAGSFRVARYQRGYRWGNIEVERLLNDIWENGDKDYSLQPVVVKQDAENEWELVDGQQRLTTLYLIFTYMQQAGLKNVGPQYSLSYDTRPKSEDYLQVPDPSFADDNIDFFHIHAAYTCIEEWFNQKGPTAIKQQEIADDVFRYLCKRVRVIWYEAPKGLDSTTLFTRLNVGRIPLTDAELFKALLLSRDRGDAVGSTAGRTHEIAAQWDTIERDLQRPEVWAFVADDVTVDTPTRITLLLDTLASGPRGRTRPRFHTFDVLREKVENSGAYAVWNQIVQLHALVLGWYESLDHYHKIGYLVSVGQHFSDLVTLAANRAKSEFGAILDRRIRESLDLTPSGVTALSYESDPQKCSRLLHLMNVETVRRMKDSTERYPFRIHRSQEWSLEHIHAQHTESLTRLEQWKDWLWHHREALAELPVIDAVQRTELLAKIDNVGDRFDRQVFQSLAREVTNAFTLADTSAGTATHSMHSVSNLTLLASSHNSALNNAVFEVKRRRILELDRRGGYIPACTRHVFLKYYTNADAQQVHFWSSQDREAYLAAILSLDWGVGVYLKTEAPAP